jgi:hypothetical protein
VWYCYLVLSLKLIDLKMALIGQSFEDQSKSKLSPAARRALAKLADFPDGSPESLLLAHGFKRKLISGLVSAGLATAKPEIMQAGERALHVTRITITAAGRAALERPIRELEA